MRTYIDLNIYNSNLHLLVVFALSVLAFIMLATFKTKSPPPDDRYGRNEQQFDTGSFRELLAFGVIIIIAIITFIFS